MPLGRLVRATRTGLFEQPFARRAGPFHNVRLETPSVRLALALLGGALFLLGLLAFLMFQSQLLFTEDAQVDDITPGAIPRNDGGIFLGAFLMGAGLGSMLIGSSPRPAAERILPALGFSAGVTVLLVVHFTLFVNAVILSDMGAAMITASFLFHDTMNALPIATFLLTFVTLVLILFTLLCGLALVAPTFWQRRILHPQDPESHRTRLVLLALLLLGTGAAFTRQFIAYALIGDIRPEGGLFRPNITIVYYLLGFTMLSALAVLALRTYILAWGDLRGAKSRNFRQSYRALTLSESVIWALILLLTGVILLAGPTYRPDGGVDRVFSMDSKGVSIFFLIVAALYAVHRRLSRRYLQTVGRRFDAPTGVGWDALATLTATVVAVWSLIALATWSLDLAPPTALVLRIVPLAALLPFFALRFSGTGPHRLMLRGPGAPYILLAATGIAVLGAIMLWGIGNSATTRYTQADGFTALGAPILQSYAVWVRLLGAFFLAIPMTWGLWLLAQRGGRVHPAPLLVVAFSTLIGMNLLFEVGLADPFDATVGRTDVLIGFSLVRLTPAQQAFLVPLRLATAAVGLVAAGLLVRQGARGEPRADPHSVRDAQRVDDRRPAAA